MTLKQVGFSSDTSCEGPECLRGLEFGTCRSWPWLGTKLLGPLKYSVAMGRKLKIASKSLAVFGIIVVCLGLYGITHPPQHDHSRCILVADAILAQYAQEHGHFPYSSNGYVDAILSVTTNREFFRYFTAAGYSTKVFEYALAHGTHVPEKECGRVYVQVPGTNRDPNIVLLFDKKSRRGGREVLGPCGHFFKDAEWPGFVKRQIELLIAAGVSQEQAENYFDETK